MRQQKLPQFTSFSYLADPNYETDEKNRGTRREKS